MAASCASTERHSDKMRELWLESIVFSDTLIARDKTARAFQYTARMLFGITDFEFFGNLLRALSLSRKTLRFYKPVKAAKRIEDTMADPSLDALEKKLTVVEIGSDGLYAAIDHITFLQRIGALKWMRPKAVDMLDRVLEFFWFTEIVPVIWRESRTLLRLQRQSAELDAKQSEDRKKESLMCLDAKRRKALILLFKAAVCDLPCSFYFMQPLSFKNKRVHKAWCGLLGLLASLISIQQNWPRKKLQ
eukprot:TRINITY_DN52411_c0_g1_i1.p1 TRINITY_DN52411_c0_g1~~TRINITY_DN52411_c0_g1_i1.p1  ORF type:complete len:247 (+),score=64.58 TRINITY_DN52411_c0_g1_i1:127-867(+)